MKNLSQLGGPHGRYPPRYPHIYRIPMAYRVLPSTVSIGVASSPASGRTCDALILAAKKALFEAQRSGRNNVFAFHGEHAGESVL